MKRVLSVCSLIILMLLLTNCSLSRNIEIVSIEIPNIESWKEIVYSEDSNNDKNDRGWIFIRWFQDPRGNGYYGMVLYYKLTNSADPISIVKAWGFRKDSGGSYDWNETRVALWLEDKGVWFVGDQGERLKVSRQYKDGNTISVTYTFEGRNHKVSKTVRLEERPNMLELQPYPNNP